MKRLKNIEGRNEEQLINKLKLIKNGGVNKESLNKLNFINQRGQDEKEKHNETNNIDNEIAYKKLVYVHTNGKFMTLLLLGD